MTSDGVQVVVPDMWLFNDKDVGPTLVVSLRECGWEVIPSFDPLTRHTKAPRERVKAAKELLQ